IVLLNPKNRGTRVELAVVELALDAELVIGAFEGVEALAADVFTVLRLEDIGVAGIRGDVLAEVDNDADIRGNHTGFFGERGGGSGAGYGTVPLGFFPIADAAAKNYRHCVDRIQP